MKSMTHAKKLVSVICAFAMVLSLCAVAPKPAKAAGTITPDSATTSTGFAETLTTHTITLAADAQASDITALTLNESGVLMISASAPALASNVRMGLYSDAACTQAIGYDMYLSASSISDAQAYTIPAAGVYYLKAYYSVYSVSSASAATINFQAVAFSGEDKVMTPNTSVVTYTNSQKTVYHQITLDKDSVIYVTGSSFSLTSGTISGITITLYNSNKNEVCPSDYLYEGNSYGSYYVLKKGTYYVGSNDSSLYQLIYTAVNAKKAKAGTSKAKAVTLKKGKQITNALFTGDAANKAQWYKVRLTKKSKIKFITGGYGNNLGYYNLEIIPASKKLIITNSKANITVNETTHKLRTRDKLPAGTYYIKINKPNKNDGVYYSLKVNY